MGDTSELSVSISRRAAENSNGFSIDMGGSAVKLAYLHKDDWRELQKQGLSQDIQTVKLRLKVFANDNLEEALEFLSTNCHIKRDNDESPVVNGSGVGCDHFSHLIKNKLNVTTQIINGPRCFAKAFRELAGTVQRDDFEYVITEERSEELRAIMVRWWDMRALVNEDRDDDRRALRHLKAKSWYMGSKMKAKNVNLPLAQVLPKLYPALLYIVSSASFFLMVRDENNCEAFACNLSGGMMFLGLGNTICRSKKSFDELVDMAEKGDYTAVDETASVYKSSREEQETDYSALTNKVLAGNETLYAFRKMISDPSASYRDEDLILSLLKTVIRTYVQAVVTTAESTGMQHVYLAGSFFNRELVRNLFEEEFCRQIVFASKWNDEKGMDIEIHFVKTGGYLAAIGAFLESTTSQPEN